MLIVFCTAPTESEAEKLAELLIEQNLAACVQLVPGMKSFYRWKGAVQHDSEVLLLIKTAAEKFDELRLAIETAHSYEVPEIVAVEASAVAEKYGAWLHQTLRTSD
jgi:periplasmic divalent cation tolerance protein